jgi:hypothetical protein
MNVSVKRKPNRCKSETLNSVSKVKKYILKNRTPNRTPCYMPLNDII